jgi:plastocyanin
VRRAAALAAGALLLAAAPASADETITAGPGPNTFSQLEWTIDQGEFVTFKNDDKTGAVHDVTSDQKGLFGSETIAGGKSAPVRGAEFLTTGSYGFYCSVHTFMTAKLNVTSAGTPQPRPGTTGDTTPAEASIAVADSKIPTVLKRKALRVRAKSSEAAGFVFTAKSGKTTIATGTASVPGSKTVALKLTAAGRKLLSRAKSAKVAVSANVTDGAGNSSRASASRLLRR